jgi:hypothetical protein
MVYNVLRLKASRTQFLTLSNNSTGSVPISIEDLLSISPNKSPAALHATEVFERFVGKAADFVRCFPENLKFECQAPNYRHRLTASDGAASAP